MKFKDILIDALVLLMVLTLISVIFFIKDCVANSKELDEIKREIKNISAVQIITEQNNITEVNNIGYNDTHILNSINLTQQELEEMEIKLNEELDTLRLEIEDLRLRVKHYKADIKEAQALALPNGIIDTTI